MRLNVVFVLIIIFLIGCSSLDTNFEINNENNDVIVVNDFPYLDSNKENVASDVDFQVIKGFLPDEEQIEKINLQGENFEYIELDGENILSGTIIFENITDENLKIKTLFLQGDEMAEIKPSSSKEWMPYISYDLASKSSVRINIDIKWDKNGASELTFFPLNEENDLDRYNGGNLSTYRFYVHNSDRNINSVVDEYMINEQSFELEDKEIENIFPMLSWVNKEGESIEFTVDDQENKLMTTERLYGVKLEKIPYNTKIDLIAMDEFGNTYNLVDDMKIKKNEDIFINIDKKKMDEMYSSNNRFFIMIFNNRDEEIIADVKALDNRDKPFLTSYQGVLEFYSLCPDC